MNLKIKTIKLIDSIISKPLSVIVRSSIRPAAGPLRAVKRILVIRPGGIGDAVLLIPALVKLKEKFPDARIDVLAEKRNAGIFSTCSCIDRIFLYDNLRDLDLLTVCRTEYDIVIDTEQWHRLSSIVARITSAPVRAGFGTNERAVNFTEVVHYSQNDYEAQSFLDLVSSVTGEEYIFDPETDYIIPDKQGMKTTGSLLKNYRKRFSRLAGIFPGASVVERKWGVKNYALLAERLLDHGVGIVVVGGKTDRSDAALLERILHGRDILNLAGSTTLSEAVAILSHLDLFISADTGLMHIASAAGTATVSLFGAGIQEKWGPRRKNNRTINKHRFCSPCTTFGHTPPCPYNVQCLRDITVDEVFENAMEMLGDK